MITPFQVQTPVTNVYTLPRCRAQLFVDNGDGTAGALVWTALQVENLRVAARIDRVATFSTGIPFKIRRAMEQSYEITIDAVWNIASVMSRSAEYILVCTWLDASFTTPTQYVRRTFYGVTTESSDVASRDGNEFTSAHVLIAQSEQQTTGLYSEIAGEF